MVKVWNCHKIRHQPNRRIPHGRPTIMYRMPRVYSTKDYICPVPPEEIEITSEECKFKDVDPCDSDVSELCVLLMVENNWDIPADPYAAAELYTQLRMQILQEL